MPIQMTISRLQARELLVALQSRQRTLGRWSRDKSGRAILTEEQKAVQEMLEGLEQAIDQDMALEDQEKAQQESAWVPAEYEEKPVPKGNISTGYPNSNTGL